MVEILQLAVTTAILATLLYKLQRKAPEPEPALPPPIEHPATRPAYKKGHPAGHDTMYEIMLKGPNGWEPHGHVREGTALWQAVFDKPGQALKNSRGEIEEGVQ